MVGKPDSNSCCKYFVLFHTCTSVSKSIVSCEVLGIKLIHTIHLIFSPDGLAGFSDDFGVGFH
jgi:hypothetical protein